ncbi:MAG: FeoB-associated Cys-rich membrane protein [Oscillospiraceae bacterium]|nr:FeoB-associated Cys-rich membrane protein [Oscillospiraceae bacterium]
MVDWFINNISSILAATAVILAVVLSIRGMVRDRKAGKSACGGNCGACGCCTGCHPQGKDSKQ